ncbi:unnamed protein product [Rhizophagus irregularis]|nr:unnamed protein product [Rhizophagus irregularis]
MLPLALKQQNIPSCLSSVPSYQTNQLSKFLIISLGGDKKKLWMYNTKFLQLLCDTSGLPRAPETVLEECFNRDGFFLKLKEKNFAPFDDLSAPIPLHWSHSPFLTFQVRVHLNSPITYKKKRNISMAIYENRPYKSATEVIEKVVKKNPTYKSYLGDVRTQLESCSYAPFSLLDNEDDSDEYKSLNSNDNVIEMDVDK